MSDKCTCKKRTILYGEKYYKNNENPPVDMTIACKECNYTPPGMIYDATAKKNCIPKNTSLFIEPKKK